MHRPISAIAGAVVLALAGPALAADDTAGTTTAEDTETLELSVKDDAVAEAREETLDRDDDDALEMKIKKETPEPRENWLTGETDAVPDSD